MRQAAILRVLRHLAPTVVLIATAAFGFGASSPDPALRISNETAPPGGWAQIKIYAVKPMAIASGHLVLNLNATAFGPGAMVGLFGANADAAGLATTTGAQIDVQFSSPTSGIGQLAGLPVMVISVPILASASGTVTVSATSPDSSVTVASGSVTIQGTLSVQKIYAGMGVVPAGTVVPVYGSGFTSSTMVAIDGVGIASTRFVSASEVDVTLGGATELLGKRVQVTDGGAEFDYFCFQPNDPVNIQETSSLGSLFTNVQPMFPLSAATGFTGANNMTGGAVAVQNSNQTAASVSFTKLDQAGIGTVQTTVPIPAGNWAIFDGSIEGSFVGVSNLPVRYLPIFFCSLPRLRCLVYSSAVPSAATPYDNATQGPVAIATPSSLAFAWEIGSATLPAARTVSVASSIGSATINLAVATGGSWLSAVNQPGARSVSVNPSGLALGTYQGSISISANSLTTTTLPVSLAVTGTPVATISAAPGSVSFTVPSTAATPYSQTIAITSDGSPAPFSVALQPGTWLQVSPMSGVTPATLTVTWNPAVTRQLSFLQSSTSDPIVISGLANTITIPATFNVAGVEAYKVPDGLVFSGQIGSVLLTYTIVISPSGTILALGSEPWIKVSKPAYPPNSEPTVAVSVNPAGLGAGIYTGSVTVSEPGIAPLVVPVTLALYATPPHIAISPTGFTFVQTLGEPAPSYQLAEVDSSGVPLPLGVSTDVSWLGFSYTSYGPTPAPIQVGIVNPPQALGEYDGLFTVQAPGSSVYVPVTLLVEPGPVTPPVVSQVVNGASGIAGGVSPGEVLTIRGYSVGAAAVSGIKLDPSGAVVSQSNGVHVAFDGEPAPLIYTSAYQTNLIVPYEVAGKTSTVMQVTYAAAAGTFQTSAWTLPVVAAAPGVFTIDSTASVKARSSIRTAR